MSLMNFKNDLAKSTFGITLTEAHEKKICVSCREVVDTYHLSSMDQREYNISALCPKCFDEITRHG